MEAHPFQQLLPDRRGPNIKWVCDEANRSMSKFGTAIGFRVDILRFQGGSLRDGEGGLGQETMRHRTGDQ